MNTIGITGFGMFQAASKEAEFAYTRVKDIWQEQLGEEETNEKIDNKMEPQNPNRKPETNSADIAQDNN